MGPGTRIGSLNVIKGMNILHLQENARIGNLNWISGLPTTTDKHFLQNKKRRPQLIMGAESAITHRHLIDCTDTVSIGKYSTLGGWYSQILTHSIDVESNRQDAQPVKIGDYCFIGTRAILLKGACLPDNSLLAAGAVLNDSFSEPFTIFGGVPAKRIGSIDKAAKYMHRSEGFVF
jgi:acetyltransferase-like isoleucine patch superfamily enzyme